MTIPEKNAPLTEKEITQAADTFFPLLDIILHYFESIFNLGPFRHSGKNDI